MKSLAQRAKKCKVSVQKYYFFCEAKDSAFEPLSPSDIMKK